MIYVGCVVEKSEGDVPGAAGYVEHFPAGGGGGLVLGGAGGGGRRGEAGVDGAHEVVSAVSVRWCICMRFT